MRRLTLVVISCLLLFSCAPVPVRTQNPKNPELTLSERAVVEGIKIKKGQSFTDCVQVSLEAVFNFYGTNINRKEISDQIQKFSGTSIPDMIAFVRERGFNIFCFHDEGKDKKWIKYFLSQNMPVMVTVGYMRYGHMMVLVGYDDNKKIFYVADPEWRDIQKWRYQEFNEWHYKIQEGNEAFLVYPESKQIEALSGGKIPTELKKYSKIHGIANAKKRQYDQAISNYTKAIEIDPKDAWTYTNRGRAYWNKGQHDQAISDYTKAIEIDPRYAGAYNNLAWLFATAKEANFRNGEKALEFALKACELSNWKNPSYLDTLAAAYARASDFDNAVKWQKKALEFPDFENNKEAQQRFKFYKERKPWPAD